MIKNMLSNWTIVTLSDCNKTQKGSRIACKQTLNHSAKLSIFYF